MVIEPEARDTPFLLVAANGQVQALKNLIGGSGCRCPSTWSFKNSLAFRGGI